jgi:hypothetical protein
MLEKACTVAQLIESLSKMPPELPVRLEGCDCEGIASGEARVVDDVFEKRKYVRVVRGEP